MKKVLIIGAAGQLGSSLVHEAESFGYEPIHFLKKELDVTNPGQLEDKINTVKPEVVINAAAFHNVPKCEDFPEEAMRVNAASVYRLAKICLKRRALLVTYSTDYVFDGERGKPISEDQPVSPLQIYGISKAAGEFAVLAAYPEGSFIVRTSALYGGKAGSRSKGGNFVLNILKEARGKDTIEVSSEQIVNPTFAGDLAQATLRLLQFDAKPGIYHLVNEGCCSWAEFAEEILRLAGMKTRVIPVDRGAKSGTMRRPKFSALQNIKAKKVGISLPPWREGTASYFKLLNS